MSLFLLSLFSFLNCYYYYYVKEKQKNKNLRIGYFYHWIYAWYTDDLKQISSLPFCGLVFVRVYYDWWSQDWMFARDSWCPAQAHVGVWTRDWRWWPPSTFALGRWIYLLLLSKCRITSHKPQFTHTVPALLAWSGLESSRRDFPRISQSFLLLPTLRYPSPPPSLSLLAGIKSVPSEVFSFYKDSSRTCYLNNNHL